MLWQMWVGEGAMSGMSMQLPWGQGTALKKEHFRHAPFLQLQQVPGLPVGLVIDLFFSAKKKGPSWSIPNSKRPTSKPKTLTLTFWKMSWNSSFGSLVGIFSFWYWTLTGGSQYLFDGLTSVEGMAAQVWLYLLSGIGASSSTNPWMLYLNRVPS